MSSLKRYKIDFISLTSMTLLCIALVFSTVAKGDEISDRTNCDLLIQFLPEGIQENLISTCEGTTNSQTIATAKLTVPASRVLDIQRALVSAYAIEPLRFVCCGFETKPVILPLPRNHPLNNETQNGAFRSVILSFSALAILNKDDGIFVQKLGQTDAFLTIALVEY